MGIEDKMIEEKITESQNTAPLVGNPRRDYLLPASILIAALLISVALVYNVGKKSAPTDLSNSQNSGSGIVNNAAEPAPDNVSPVSAADHILGSLDAPVKIIEFSDLECPFCKLFHPTLQKILADYTGQVAWIYRHFPLDSLHSKARKEAEASECAAELGGNQKFWDYIGKIFEITPSNNGLDPNKLPQIAADIGLDQTKFSDCLNSGRHASKVAANLSDAINSGGRGTPYTIVITKSGQKYPIDGALPYEQVKAVIDQALK